MKLMINIAIALLLSACATQEPNENARQAKAERDLNMQLMKAEQLARLDEMRKRGLISEAEYERLKNGHFVDK